MHLEIKKFSKFKLLKQIARGGMAEIFLGCSGTVESAHKFVVIKRISLSHSHNKEFNKMFQNEGKIAVNLGHSNIGSIYEFGVEKNQYFICMEYISGRNVRQLVKKLKSQKQKLSAAICAYIIKYVCNGLDYAHNCTDSVTGQPLNIIHRDISPQNIMVSFSGDVKIIDFGIAKIDDSEATRAGVLKGKFEYMSPEQARGKCLDRQTDIFSLANVLWELLAGKKLFTGSNEIQLLKKIRDCRIPDLKKLNSNVPGKLIDIVNKGLSANKNLRYKTAEEMGNDLSVFLNKTYPDFTHSNFSTFIKELYVEEILEERQNLKLYSQALVTKQSSLQTSFLSSSLQQTDHSSSTFTEFNKNRESVEDSAADESGAMGDSGFSKDKNAKYTLTETQQDSDPNIQHHTGETQEMTKTEFEDELDSNLSGHKWGGQSDIGVVYSDGFRQFVTTSSTSSTGGLNSTYQPWKNFSLTKDQLKKLRQSGSVKRLSNVKRIMISSLFIIGVIGFFYFFAPVSKNIFSDNDQISRDRQRDKTNRIGSEHNSKQPNIGTAASEPEKTVSSRVPTTATDISGKLVFGKSIFVTTQPSGAHVYLNNKNVNRVTPTSIVVPIDNSFQLVFKREGYNDKKVVLSPSSIKRKRVINFSLEKNQKRIRQESPVIIR